MIIPLKNLFKLTDLQLINLAIIYYISKSIGNFFSPHLSLKIDKVKIIKFSLFILSIVSITLGIYLNLVNFYFTRIISGFFVGCIESLMINNLCEHLPIELRGFYLTSIWIGSNIGQLILNLLMLILMPNYEIEIINLVIIYSSIIPVCSLFINLTFLKSSIRYLILNNNYDLAHESLKKLKPSISIEEMNLIEIETLEGINNSTESNIIELFKNKFLSLTLKIMVINMISNILNDGIMVILNLTLEKLNNSSSYLRDYLTILLISLPSCVISGAFTEIKFFGRKFSMVMGCVMLIIFSLATILYPESIKYFMGFYLVNVSFVNIVINTYYSEVYPSRLRDMSSSLMYSVGNLGSFISQIIFLWFHSLNLYIPYYSVIVLSIIAGFLIYFLPYDTYQRPLDSDKLDYNENIRKFE